MFVRHDYTQVSTATGSLCQPDKSRAVQMFPHNRTHISMLVYNSDWIISVFHCAFFNSIIYKHQHMHFTFNNMLV